MNNLTLINTNDFNGISCDVYGDGSKIFMTRRQIGEALGYDDPIRAISHLHDRHKDRIEPNSVVVKLSTTDNKMYDTCVYNQRGIMEICRWSRTKVADSFIDWVWDIIEAYRDGTLSVPQPNNTALSVEAVETMVDNRIQYITKGLSDKIQELQEKIEDVTSRTLPKPSPSGQDTASNQMTKILKGCGFNGFDDMKEKMIKRACKSPEEIIKETIEPLAKLYDDKTLGYTYTYHKVYSGMDVSWKHRLGRYRNKHNTKRNPSKSKLIANDPKLMRMFVDVVNQLAEEQEQAVTA